MNKTAMNPHAGHRDLRGAHPFVAGISCLAQIRCIGVTGKAPINPGAQHQRIKRAHWRIREELIGEVGRPIDALEEEPKRMFGHIFPTAGPALDSDSRIHLKTRFNCRRQQFNGGGIFSFDPPALRIAV